MKKCVNCGRESSGNFCGFCGGNVIEEVQDYRIQGIPENINNVAFQMNGIEQNIKPRKRNIFKIFTIILLLIVIVLAAGIVMSIMYYEDRLSTLYGHMNDYYNENQELKRKADFLDENIVFVLKGYGNYYYTYDQVQQVTQGREYSFWAYNRAAAISKGYTAWQ